MHELPEARAIVETLHRAGFVAYYAGGWVRDFLLHRPSDDMDIATNATPETIQKLFPNTVPIGIAFGIILVVQDGQPFEVATFRQDISYQDGRRPERVQFSTAEEDAKRRDFTINGLFYDPIRKEILDYVNGREDIHAGLIRAIGNPHERIQEDRLRMIRGIRLACRFNFQIEKKTEEAIRAHVKELFPSVAIERVVQELEKAHAFHCLTSMLLMLHDYGLLDIIFPEIESASTQEIQERLAPTNQYPHETPLIVFLLTLFPNLLLDQQITLAQKLKTPNRDVQFITFLSQARRLIDSDLAHSLIENVDWAHLYANPFWSLALPIIASHIEESKQQSFLQQHDARIRSLHMPIDRIRRHAPVVTAAKLKEAGIEPGKQMGILLKEAERISCNQLIDDPNRVIERLQQTPFWPSGL